ncbi:DUF1850 domain-containing protein [Thiolinea disciformis]|uniref:DUF1850 domain-containing protein n=1 Tax=Thiolinea disciformis TaxID=125614 RepID=UPI00035C40F3|nr:DUF1850 domain-containing protein [Thiolinea disciformis]
MSLCIVSAGKTLVLASTFFSLSWTHSVEKIEWQEDWHVENHSLRLINARVKGSGAGMEPGENAQLKNGWWEWQPQLPAQTELILAASGTTPSAWKLCPQQQACLDLAQHPSEPIKLWVCDPSLITQ